MALAAPAGGIFSVRDVHLLTRWRFEGPAVAQRNCRWCGSLSHELAVCLEPLDSAVQCVRSCVRVRFVAPELLSPAPLRQLLLCPLPAPPELFLAARALEGKAHAEISMARADTLRSA